MGLFNRQATVQKLVEDHYEALYRYAYRLSGKAADAEDLAQDAFCKAQARLEQLREEKRAKPWLFAILRNNYLHRLRDQKAAQTCSLEEVAEVAEVAEPLPERLPAIGPEQLQAALDELPEGFRTPLILYFFEDFSYRDIAEQMDLPIGTVMSRLSRAKAFLRNRLVTPEPPQPVSAERRQRDGL